MLLQSSRAMKLYHSLRNSADDKLMAFSYFSMKTGHFMQIVSIRDNLNEKSKPVFKGK